MRFHNSEAALDLIKLVVGSGDELMLSLIHILINSRQGLLPMPIAKEAAKALREVLADGDADPTKRAKTYITFEH